MRMCMKHVITVDTGAKAWKDEISVRRESWNRHSSNCYEISSVSNTASVSTRIKSAQSNTRPNEGSLNTEQCFQSLIVKLSPHLTQHRSDRSMRAGMKGHFLLFLPVWRTVHLVTSEDRCRHRPFYRWLWMESWLTPLCSDILFPDYMEGEGP